MYFKVTLINKVATLFLFEKLDISLKFKVKNGKITFQADVLYNASSLQKCLWCYTLKFPILRQNLIK